MKRTIFIFLLLIVAISVSAQAIISARTTATAQVNGGGGGGSNMISNGTFDSGSDWTPGANWTISGGVASYASGAGNTLNQLDGDMVTSIEANTGYTLKFTISGAEAYIKFTNVAGDYTYKGYDTYAVGNHTVTFTTNEFQDTFGIRITSISACTIDNIELTEGI